MHTYILSEKSDSVYDIVFVVRGRDLMVIAFTTTYAIIAYHN